MTLNSSAEFSGAARRGGAAGRERLEIVDRDVVAVHPDETGPPSLTKRDSLFPRSYSAT